MTMPKIKRIAEVVLETDNLDEMVGFYQDIMGLNLDTRDSKTAWFRWNDQLVALFDKSVVGLGVGAGAHVAYEIDECDFESAVKFLDDSGVEYDPPKTWDDGAQAVYFKDPAGHMLEIYCRPVKEIETK